MKTTRPASSIELLEARIAPATFINHSTIAYHDLDGDLVTVKLSKPLLTDLATANAIFHFDTGNVVASGTPDATPQQLQLLDFTGFTGSAGGVGITVTVKLAGNGDGFANVGRIDASGLDLGAITIKGDLGRITAGNNEFTTPGVRSLAVQSVGQFGTSTQVTGGDLVSNIAGALGALAVKSDIIGAFLSVAGDGSPAADALAKVGIITIGGSLRGTTVDESGQINATGSFGPVKIGGDVAGGEGIHSGAIRSGGNMGRVTIGGSLLGGIGVASDLIISTGALIAGGDIGPVRIGGDIRANDYALSGKIQTGGKLTGLYVGGSVFGGAGTQFSEGQISAPAGIGAIKIGGDLAGGAGRFSGTIWTSPGGEIASITIGGSLLGGLDTLNTNDLFSGFGSGSIYASGFVGSIKIGGDVRANSFHDSGKIFGRNIGSASIGGSVVGGEGSQQIEEENGVQISYAANLTIGGDVIGGSNLGGAAVYGGTVKIRGSVIGGTGPDSANIDGNIGVTIGGDLRGGDGFRSGSILEQTFFVKIGGSVIGGGGEDSGSINRVLGNVSIGGSLIGGSGPTSGVANLFGNLTMGGSVVGGEGDGSGSIQGETTIVIGGDLRGGEGEFSGLVGGQFVRSIRVAGNVIGGAGSDSARISTGVEGDVFVGGSLVGGKGEDSGFVQGEIRVTVGGSVVGGEGAGSGHIDRGRIITVGGSLVAGTGQDSGRIESRVLNSLTIRGSVVGTAEHHAVIYLTNPAIGLGVGEGPAARNVTVLGDARFGEIIGDSYGFDPFTLNGDGQLGAIKVGGDFIASSIAVSAQPGPNGYGSGDVPVPGGDSDILATIASITIGGQMLGTIGGSDHYGIVAERIGSLKIGGNSIPLIAGAHNDNRPLGITNDFTTHEI